MNSPKHQGLTNIIAIGKRKSLDTGRGNGGTVYKIVALGLKMKLELILSDSRLDSITLMAIEKNVTQKAMMESTNNKVSFKGHLDVSLTEPLAILIVGRGT